MDEPTKAFRQVKEILGRLDRSIDRARHERLRPEDEFPAREQPGGTDPERSENLAGRTTDPTTPAHTPGDAGAPHQHKPGGNGHNGHNNGPNNGNGHSGPTTPPSGGPTRPSSPPGGLDPSPEGRPRSAYGRAKPLRRSPSDEGESGSGPSSASDSQHSAIQHNPGRRTA